MMLLLLPEQNISLEQLKARRICFSSQFHGREAQQPGFVTGAETCGLTSSIWWILRQGLRLELSLAITL